VPVLHGINGTSIGFRDAGEKALRRYKGGAAVSRVKVSAYGHGVSHGGVGMLREVAELTGLSAEVTAVMADTYRGHGSTSRVRCSRIWPRGRRRSGLHRRRRAQRCGDRERVFGAAASSTTIWRLVDAALCPVSGLPARTRGCARPLSRSVAAPWMSMPPPLSTIRQQARRDGTPEHHRRLIAGDRIARRHP